MAVMQQGGARVIERTVRIAGEDRVLRYDFNALAEMEAVGFDLMGGGVTTVTAGFVRAFVWAGLTSRQMYEEGRRYRGPRHALHEVGGMLAHEDTQQDVTAVIMDLIAAGSPDEPGDADNADGDDGEAGKDTAEKSSKPSPSSTSD
ncbi:MAG: hypothetical protein ACOC8B_08480 [Gemmatimonadota bacterium]